MKTFALIWVAVCTSCTLFGATDEPAFYLRTEGGPAFLKTLRVDYGIGHFDEPSEIGTRFDLTFGYRFLSSLSAELDSGMIWNKLQDLAQHDFYQVPLMANFVWKYPYGRVAPFVGIGGGAIDLILMPNGPYSGSSESHFVFGGQAFAGMGYRLTRACELGLSVRFLGASSERFVSEGSVRIGPALSHSIQAEFSIKF